MIRAQHTYANGVIHSCRSTTAIRLGRKRQGDPVQEMFAGDTEANSCRPRDWRGPYGYDMILVTGLVAWRLPHAL